MRTCSRRPPHPSVYRVESASHSHPLASFNSHPTPENSPIHPTSTRNVPLHRCLKTYFIHSSTIAASHRPLPSNSVIEIVAVETDRHVLRRWAPLQFRSTLGI